MKKILLIIISLLILLGCSSNSNNKNLKEITLVLDWVPNTNHTGLFVAMEKEYDIKHGIKLNVIRPPEGSTTEIVALNKEYLGISFQDSLAYKFLKNIDISVVATIINHNTSGIISLKDKNIVKMSDLENKSYGTWDDEIEKAMIKFLMEKEGAKFTNLKLVPNLGDNSLTGLINNQFDSAWIYYGWDGIMADHLKYDHNFIMLKDVDSRLDFYSPVIIANNHLVNNEKELLKKVMSAIKEGYVYTMNNPKEAADILIKHAPELKDSKEFVYLSQQYLSSQYASSPQLWGKIDQNRWQNFYNWLFEQKIIDKRLDNKPLFTNEFLEE